MTSSSRDPDDLLLTLEVADMFRVPLSTVYAWRYRGVGPPATKIGKHLRWRRGDVERWLSDRPTR